MLSFVFLSGNQLLPINQWHQQIQDPTLADAILDHIVHDSLRLVLSGESMRKLTSSLNGIVNLI